MRLSPAIALAAFAIAAPAAHAQMTPAFSHEGLYLRAEAGVSYLHTQADFADTSASAYGGGGYLSFAVGGAIAPDLILFGEIWGMAAPSPTGQFGSTTVTSNNNDITLNYGGLGVGLGYFFMPANVFFAISVDATRLGITNHDNGDQSNSDIGGAVTLTLGKQFWLSDHWGLGFAIKGIGGRQPGQQRQQQLGQLQDVLGPRHHRADVRGRDERGFAQTRPGLGSQRSRRGAESCSGRAKLQRGRLSGALPTRTARPGLESSRSQGGPQRL